MTFSGGKRIFKVDVETRRDALIETECTPVSESNSESTPADGDSGVPELVYDSDDDDSSVEVRAFPARVHNVRPAGVSSECVEVILDSGSNGNLLPASVLSNVRKPRKAVFVDGIGGRAELSHVGYSELLKGKSYVPLDEKFLASIPMLDKQGCTIVVKGGVMRVYEPDGALRIEGRLNAENMYTFWMSRLQKQVVVRDGKAVRAYPSYAADGDDMSESEDEQGQRPPVDDPTPQEQLLHLNGMVQHRVQHYNRRSIRTAEEARDFHRKMGHPDDKVLGPGLDAGCYAGTDLTYADLRVAEDVMGPCDACIEGKMTRPPEPSSNRWHDTGVGHTLYYDLIKLKHKSIGGNWWMLLGTESSCAHMTVSYMKLKEKEPVFAAVRKAVAEYNQYGHRVRKVVFDDEAVFKSTFPEIRLFGIEPSTYPAGEKNKTIERKVRELNDKKRCMKASLKYVMPDKLEAEMIMAVVIAMNSVSNSKTGPRTTPYQIVSGKKVTRQPFKYGEVGLANARRNDEPDQRAEYGLFLYAIHDQQNHM